MVRVVIAGACGRMGTRIHSIARHDKLIKVVGLIETSASPDIGTTRDGCLVTADTGCLEHADVLIDFTTPQGVLQHLDSAARCGVAMVIGVTGLSEGDRKKIARAARKIPVVFSPNMSIGVTLLFDLVREAARTLTLKDARITEAHHVHKKDAPSGTAKRLAEIISEESGTPVSDITSIREGEIIGDHRVVFETEFDTLVLEHSAKTRDIFAKGAVEAAKWVASRPRGLYGMNDVMRSVKRASKRKKV